MVKEAKVLNEIEQLHELYYPERVSTRDLLIVTKKSTHQIVPDYLRYSIF